MPKSEMEQKFDYLVSKVIWTHFKPLGYKKRGNNFRYYERDFGKIVNFQKSSFGDKDNIHFTINIGLYLRDFQFYLMGKYSSDKFCESHCAVRRRIGELITNRDTWFDLNAEADIAKIYKEVDSAFVKFVLPYLDTINSKEDILRLMKNSSLMLAGLKTLYHNGYQDDALKLLDKKYKAVKNNPALLKNLDDFKKEMLEGRAIVIQGDK
jgi:hypothetical protein